MFQRQPGVPIFVEHWGNILQFYPNFVLFSTFGGEEPQLRFFFQASKLSKDQKINSSPKMKEFFPRIQMKTKERKVFIEFK